MATSTYDDARVPRQTEARPPRRRRVVLWFVIVAVLLGLVGGGIYGFDQLRRKAIANFFATQVQPPTPVAATPAEIGPMPRYLDGIGSPPALRGGHVGPQGGGRGAGVTLPPGA